MTRLRPTAVPAAWWALRVARQAHLQLDRGGLDNLSLAPAPSAPGAAVFGVTVVLRLRRERCLVRSAVLQAWHLGQGRHYDLVIGVTSPGDDFTAHAWLEGDPSAAAFTEMTRRAPEQQPITR